MVRRGWGAGAGLTLAAMGVLGYHPYAEDGGIYLAEVKRRLDPGLYPVGSEFVSGHLGSPVFAVGVAGLVPSTGLSLAVVMLGVQALCVGGVLLGVWLLARRCYASVEARAGAVGAVALAMGMPVAGTSLMLMDPYGTARSATSMFVLLGLAGVVAYREDGRRGALGWALAAFLAGVMVHPLMGGFGCVAGLVLGCVMDRRRGVRWSGVAGVALGAMAAGYAAQRLAPAESADYLRVMATRYYWFLASWHWYEWLGLVGPMGILGWVGWRGVGVERGLARMGVVTGGVAVMVAAVFAQQGARVHAVARIQPLRCFQVVYVVMLMVLGAAMGRYVLRGALWRWGLAAAALGGGMLGVQRETYPASDHLEVPGMRLRNEWEQAFVWVRENTPKDAVFALDADYVHDVGEDAQGFRAIAERSALADYSKDGGQASIRPELTGAWVAGQSAQARLSEETDAERMAALRGTGVSWVVLEQGARTGFACPYRNARVMVCRVANGVK